MKIWVYGDSWPDGCELENDLGQSRPELAFPAMLAQKFNCQVINRAVTGSSQPFLIESFLDSQTQPGDIAIFCLTAKTRRMYRGINNEIVEQQFTHDEMLVNQYEDERVSAQVCALLYFLSKEIKVIPYFFNLFDTVRYGNKLQNVIPDNHWLIPQNHSVLSWLFDPVFFTRFADHHNGDFREWLDRNCDLVQKYIRPCIAHPNLHGHETIANFLADALVSKGHFCV